MGAPDEQMDAECCILHTFERATRICHDCGHWHCEQCLVTPWGPRKAALCVTCAIARGGVRKTATNAPARPVKEIRQLERQVRKDMDHAASRTSGRSLHRAADAVAHARDDEPSRRKRLVAKLRPGS